MAHTFDTYLQEFLNWLQNEKTCSVNTITAYRKDLEQFGAFLEQEKLSVEDITYRELRFYMASLQRNQELKKTTLSRKTAALKSFFKFLNRDGLIEHNPADLLSAPKKEKHLPSVITEIDMVSFLDDHLSGENPAQLRDKAIFELLYSSGLRVSELVDIDVSDKRNFAYHRERQQGAYRTGRRTGTICYRTLFGKRKKFVIKKREIRRCRIGIVFKSAGRQTYRPRCTVFVRTVYQKRGTKIQSIASCVSPYICYPSFK